MVDIRCDVHIFWKTLLQAWAMRWNEWIWRRCRAKQHSQGLFPPFFMTFFNLSISTDKLDTRLQPGYFRDYIFQLLGPLYTQRIKQDGADSRKVVSLIWSKNAFIWTGQIKLIFFFIKFSGDISIRLLLYT